MEKLFIFLFNPIVMILSFFILIFLAIALFNIWGCIAVIILFYFINKNKPIDRIT